ncbi:putative major head protein/prohead protease [Escherichia coli]|nr:putative major head protein/prohead protease [Escherichia coli]
MRRVREGLEITAMLVKPEPGMPSQMAARLDEAWAAIKTGLVRGLSVGFRPHEYTYLDGGGLHFLRWELMEVSAVTVPANAECTIRTIKYFDRPFFCRVRQPETGGENRIFCRRFGTVQ